MVEQTPEERRVVSSILTRGTIKTPVTAGIFLLITYLKPLHSILIEFGEADGK